MPDDGLILHFDSANESRPREFIVRRDGQPFAILNATPALAASTVAGFARATPEARWSVERR